MADSSDHSQAPKTNGVRNLAGWSLEPPKTAVIVGGVTTGAVEGFDGKDARSARERLGLTQFQVAVELGITPQHVSNFERGRHQLSGRVRWQLAELLGLPHGDMQPAPESRLEALQSEMADLKRQLSELTTMVEQALAASPRADAKPPASPSSGRRRPQAE